jgi:excinuclease ABC subunit C
LTDNINHSEFPKLSEKLKNLPKEPGVYKFKSKTGKVIYVGKAKNLRNRVRSYFQKRGPADAKTKAMTPKIADVEYIITGSEAEALLLEDTLIKQLKPRYNILLKDDRSYPYVRITKEEYPRILITRKIIRDGSKYIGPFTEVRKLRQLMRLIRRLFYVRSCDYPINQKTIEEKKYKLCLDYHINKCEGPCEGLVSKEKYNAGIRAAIDVINGKTKELEKTLINTMNQLSAELKFEEAAQVRNRLQLLSDYNQSQNIVTSDLIDRDIIGLARIDDTACTLILKIRDGKLIGSRHYIVGSSLNYTDEQIIQRTLEKWYVENEFIPKEVILPVAPLDSEFLGHWLREKRGKTVSIIIPKSGEKKKLVKMASVNAEYILREYHLAMSKRQQTASRAVLSLQRDLRLSAPPLRIECFDNSHFQGTDYVAAMVVFVNGRPEKKLYRKYKIETVDGNDDYAAMREVIRRRYSKIDDDKNKLPDLIIIDGGKGQLSSALEVLDDLNLTKKVNVIGLAKRLEEVFLPGEKESLMLPRVSSSLRLLQNLRDEAHRFAISFHRQLRKKRTLKTELTNIHGIGQVTAQKLLKEFGSVNKIKQLEIEELEKVAGKKTANNIYKHFHNSRNEESEKT